MWGLGLFNCARTTLQPTFISPCVCMSTCAHTHTHTHTHTHITHRVLEGGPGCCAPRAKGIPSVGSKWSFDGNCKDWSPGATRDPRVHLSIPAAAKSLQSCPTLCDPRDGSPPGSTVPGILQARTLEWVAISFSNA